MMGRRKTIVRMRLKLRQVLRSERTKLSILAVLVGAAGGVVAIAFRELIDGVRFFAFGFSSENLISLSAGLAWWHLLAAPAAGGLLVGLFSRYVMAERRPLGVSDVVEAAALSGGRMPFGQALGAALISATSIGTGASVGREGPVVHLGASLAALVAGWLKLSPSLSRTLLGCGVAAAVAASFNAPIAGVFFALEVVIGHYALSAFAPIVIASVVGTVLSRSHFGDFPAFILPDYQIVSVLQFPAFAVLGVISAFVAVLFVRAIFLAEDMWRRSPLPVWSRPMIAGLMVGVIALVFPHVLGVGYEATDGALKQSLSLWLLAALVVAKLAATAICLGSGFGGGVFSPSLFIGAMLGGAYGIALGALFPGMSSGYGIYAMTGMGAVAGAVLGAPISTILIIFELIGDYQITIAVMVTVALASVIAQMLMGPSYFALQLERRGINLRGGRETSLLRDIPVRRIMKPGFASVPLSAGMEDVRLGLQSAPQGELLVVRDDGTLFGAIAFADMGAAAFDLALNRLVNASDMARRLTPRLTPDDNLVAAMDAFEGAGATRLVVVRSMDNPVPVGLLNESDVLAAYADALLRLRSEEHGPE